MIRIAISLLLAAAPASPGARAAQWVPQPDAAHPRLRYADSLVSVNDRCIVSGLKLNPHMTPSYVNGAPVGYC